MTTILLTLSRGGWGEAAFGVELARGLLSMGKETVFLTHENNVGLIANTGFEYHPIGDHIGSLVWSLITETVREKNATSIVMCDFFTCDGVLRRYGIDAQRLRQLAIPLLAVDTWGQSERRAAGPASKRGFDVFMRKSMEISSWIEEIPCLRPCPLLHPDARPGVCRFMSPPIRITRAVRRQVRTELGLASDDAIILFCTAKWQQTRYDDFDGDRCAAFVPLLLAHYCRQLDRRAHLIHVGPEPLSGLKTLGDRYKWLPPLGEKFDLLLGASDLLLTANASASTVTKAISSRIPVLVVQNSCRAETFDDAAGWLGTRATSFTEAWLRDAVPLYPFRLWPIGFFEVMEDVVRRNPYWDSVVVCELLDERNFVSQIRSLLFDPTTVHLLQEAQSQYCNLLGALPAPAQALACQLENRLCAV
ncbi:hypothetical protein ABIF65_008268 [Bradyrhizobium japonicum]